jgi:hypothetical protein
MDDRITSISARINAILSILEASDLPYDKKAELLRLLSTLQAEIAALEPTHAAHAASVVELTERSMHEVIRQTKNPELIASTTQGLSASVEELEVSHPQLVQVVNAISMLLANMGI